jgi:hypothetical protein
MSPRQFVVRFFAVASIACILGPAARAQRTSLGFVDGLDQSASHAGPGFLKSIEILQRHQSESMDPDPGRQAVERPLLLNHSAFSSHTSPVLQIPHVTNATGAQEMNELSKSSTDREISKTLWSTDSTLYTLDPHGACSLNRQGAALRSCQ